MRGKAGLIGVIVTLAVVAAVSGRDYDAAQAAAFRELLEAAHGHSVVATRSACLAVSAGEPAQWRDRRDPPPSVLARLQAERTYFYPASRCLEDGNGVWDPAHREAVLLSVGRLEWVSSDFVKTEGYWLLDGLSAQGFKLTLSRVGGKWQVDTAVPTWVS